MLSETEIIKRSWRVLEFGLKASKTLASGFRENYFFGIAIIMPFLVKSRSILYNGL